MITARRLAIHVAAVPKTVDNDIPLIDKSFGFDSAVEEAVRHVIVVGHTYEGQGKRGQEKCWCVPRSKSDPDANPLRYRSVLFTAPTRKHWQPPAVSAWSS